MPNQFKVGDFVKLRKGTTVDGVDYTGIEGWVSQIVSYEDLDKHSNVVIVINPSKVDDVVFALDGHKIRKTIFAYEYECEKIYEPSLS